MRAWTCAWIVACVGATTGCWDLRREHASYAALGVREPTGDAGPCHCGDGVVAADEECDPAAPGWEAACDDACKRTQYQACQAPEDCAGEMALCAAYTRDPGQLFCGAYCETDDECIALPGFRTVCNFAWCVVLCDDGACPHGMTCVADQSLVDHAGHPYGMAGVCVVNSR